MSSNEELIPCHGGYRSLKSFQIAQLVYDITMRFCDRYISIRSRTHDQMVQAARSGVQNIAEGSQASATSKKMELKLTQVARASLEELRLDYEDFLRQRRLQLWKREDPKRQELIDLRPKNSDDVAEWILSVYKRESGQGGPSGRSGHSEGDSSVHIKYSEIAANGALVLINVACALLDRQVASLARAFEENGGFTERLYQTRRNKRSY